MSPFAPAQESLRLQVRAAVQDSAHTQAWIARELGMTERHLSQMLTGKAHMPILWAERITALCGLEIVIGLRYRTRRVR